jgi:hypothetical protein
MARITQPATTTSPVDPAPAPSFEVDLRSVLDRLDTLTARTDKLITTADELIATVEESTTTDKGLTAGIEKLGCGR